MCHEFMGRWVISDMALEHALLSLFNRSIGINGPTGSPLSMGDQYPSPCPDCSHTINNRHHLSHHRLFITSCCVNMWASPWPYPSAWVIGRWLLCRPSVSRCPFIHVSVSCIFIGLTMMIILCPPLKKVCPAFYHRTGSHVCDFIGLTMMIIYAPHFQWGGLL